MSLGRGLRVSTRACGVVLAAGLLLTGCATDVDGELRREVADLTDEVNAGDADGVRDSAGSLIARTQAAVRNNDISPEEGARIVELATLLRDRFAALQPAEPTPTPQPSQAPPTATETETETEDDETEVEETEQETVPPAPPPSPRPPSPPPTQAPQPSPTPAPSPSGGGGTVLPEVPQG